MEELAEHLATAFATLRRLEIANRQAYSDVLRHTLEAHPRLIGAWSVWEPDSFDGRDADFRAAPGHDATGRFVPYWHRAYGAPRLDPVTGYERPGPGDWYWVPKRAVQRCVVEDYEYPVGGRPMRVRSVIVPLCESGRCVGVVGLDEAATRRIRPAAIATTPIVQAVGSGDPRLAGLTIREREIHHWIAEGKSNDEIARILHISAHTVKNHLSHIFEKLGVENRYAAALVGRANAPVMRDA